jgi:hypothetical protein
VKTCNLCSVAANAGIREGDKLVSVNDLCLDENTTYKEFVGTIMPEVKKRPCVLSFSRAGQDVGSEEWARFKGFKWPLETHPMNAHTGYTKSPWNCCGCNNPFSRVSAQSQCRLSTASARLLLMSNPSPYSTARRQRVYLLLPLTCSGQTPDRSTRPGDVIRTKPSKMAGR